MRRLLQSFAMIALAAACLGCPMPQTGLDYCAPTVDANGVPTGGFMMRQGSVLGGMPGTPVYVQQQQPTPARPEGVPTPAAQGTLANPVSATAPAGEPHIAEPAVAQEPVADMAE